MKRKEVKGRGKHTLTYISGYGLDGYDLAGTRCIGFMAAQRMQYVSDIIIRGGGGRVSTLQCVRITGKRETRVARCHVARVRR